MNLIYSARVAFGDQKMNCICYNYSF